MIGWRGLSVNEFKQLIETVEKHETDLYRGEGKDNPSITARLALLEKENQLTKDKLDKYDKLFAKALWLSVTTLIAVTTFLIKVVFFPHVG